MGKKRSLTALDIKDTRHLAKQLHFPEKALFRLRDDLNTNPGRYYLHRVIHRRGKMRALAIPRGRLRVVLDVLQPLLQRVELPSFVHGGRRGHSNIINARTHVGQPVVMCLDVEDFFPSVGYRLVYQVFSERLGCSPTVAGILTRLTTLDGCLPQGSPTSTILGAIVLERMGLRIATLCKIHGAKYTQYVDDITVSGPADTTMLLPMIERIIEQEGFQTNAKTRCQMAPTEQTVTGVRVDNGLDVPTEKLAEVKVLLKRLERIANSGGRMPQHDVLSLAGKIEYVARLNAGTGRFYRRKLREVALSYGSCHD